MMDVSHNKRVKHAMYKLKGRASFDGIICKTTVEEKERKTCEKVRENEEAYPRKISSLGLSTLFFFNNIKIVFKVIKLLVNSLKNFLGFLLNATY